MIQPRKELLKIETYETASYPEYWDMKLDSNENYIGPSTEVLKSMKELSVQDISHYPCYGSVYEILEQYLETDKSCMVLTNGADEALSCVINTYISKGDKVLNVKPAFVMPKIYSEIAGAEYIEIPYKSKWDYPCTDVKKALQDNNIKILFITTPNNPTGDVIPSEQIEALLNEFQNTLIVIDETYANFAGITNAPLIEKYENVLIVKSFSKDYGLAGLRLGLVLSKKENIDNIKKILSPYNVNIAAVCAVNAALSDDMYIDYVSNEISRSRAFLCEELRQLGYNVYRSYANFILTDFGDSCEAVYNILKENKIIVKAFKDVDCLKTCLRITVPTMSASARIVSLLKPKKTLVFDMDGVMFDVSKSYFEAIKYTYKHFTGKDLDDTEIFEARKLGGLNNDWDLTHFLIKRSGFDFSYDNIVNIFQKHYWNDGRGSINDETLLINTDLLEELSLKYNLAVFTGRPKQEALYSLNKFNIKRFFNKIVTMDDVPFDKQKPDTTGLEVIRTSLLTTDIIYFGDTVDDAKCATDFGAYGVGVLPPSDKSCEHADILLERGAKVVINDINDLTKILEKFNNEKEHN